METPRMFRWLRRLDPEHSGLARMKRHFGEMLEEGRHIFDAASNAFLGGVDPSVVEEDLFATDKNINRLERQIRREIVIHGSVHGSTELPQCLVMMSIAKDAERIGDYCKNLYDLAAIRTKSKDDAYFKDLVDLKNQISHLMAEARGLYMSQDEPQARDFMRRAGALQRHCDAKVDELLAAEPATKQPAATVLCYRYFKRVVAHTLNIVTSIVMPVDKLDFLDEDPETRDSEE